MVKPVVHRDINQAFACAEQHAADVDLHGRFPAEAVQELRAAGAMAFLLPRELGGAGLSLDEIAEITTQLSRRCASTGMIFAMHQIQVASILRHYGTSGWFQSYLLELAVNQNLIASATSEAGVGGDLRKSLAALEPISGLEFTMRMEKQAPTISYGAYADDLLLTMRRSPSAEPGDQVLVLAHFKDLQAEQVGCWDALGMRGTSSPGFLIKGNCSPDQILPTPFPVIAAETMVPVSHILWAHVWLGIAFAAFQKAQAFVRAQARKTPGITPPTALRLAELSVRFTEFRELVRSVSKEFVGMEDRTLLSTAGYMVRINNLKLSASRAVVEVCTGALQICGFSGYKNDGPYSLGRHLRDAHSSTLMIGNDRLLATNASLLLVHREAM